MKHDFSKIRFPNEGVADFDDRIPYEDILEVIAAGFGSTFDFAVRDEWERRTQNAPVARYA